MSQRSDPIRETLGDGHGTGSGRKVESWSWTGKVRTGTVSTGAVSTGTVSTGTVSTGAVSTGTVSTGTVSTGAEKAQG